MAATARAVQDVFRAANERLSERTRRPRMVLICECNDRECLADLDLPKTEWVEADVARDDLVPAFTGADAVVHLARTIQPSHDSALLWRVNVLGSQRVFEAAARAKVPALVYASSVGAYSPGPKDRFVDETWPTNGIETSFYARHKAEVERRLDTFERDHPEMGSCACGRA